MITGCSKVESDLKENVIIQHILLNHRKKIKPDLEKIGINFSQKKIDKIINECWTCLRKNAKNRNPGMFVKTFSAGEKIALDILELNKGNLVVLGIDYFTRKVFGKYLNSKEAKKILKFIEEIYSEFPIQTLITDNGKEFNNEIINDFCRREKIERLFSIPYYHQSNGRIERANKTIREALKRAN